MVDNISTDTRFPARVVPKSVAIVKMKHGEAVIDFFPSQYLPELDSTLFIKHDDIPIPIPGERSTRYCFALYPGNIEQVPLKDEPQVVFDFAYDPAYPKRFNLAHRYTYPKYRGKGISNQVFEKALEFMQERTQIRTLNLDIGQLSVYKWALKHGFTPFTDVDAEKVRLVEAYMNGDRSHLIEAMASTNELYLFPAAESSREINNAFRFNLNLEVTKREDFVISKVRNAIVERVSGN